MQHPPVGAASPPPRKRAANSCRRPLLRAAVLVLVCCCIGSAVARAGSKEQMQGLDEQVQEIKSDVLGIAAELGRLEEKLLYPSNTEVALFVSLDAGASFRLDSVEIQIDGKPVARHIYSFKELEALQKGGVQRIYTGNIPTGAHQLAVSVAGKLPGGEDFSGSQNFGFSKEVEPKIVEIKLTGQLTGGASIQLGGL